MFIHTHTCMCVYQYKSQTSIYPSFYLPPLLTISLILCLRVSFCFYINSLVSILGFQQQVITYAVYSFLLTNCIYFEPHFDPECHRNWHYSYFL